MLQSRYVVWLHYKYIYFSAHIYFDDAFEAHDDDTYEFHVNNFVRQLVRTIDQAARYEHLVTPSLSHTYQSHSCAAAIYTKFRDLFSPRRMYVKYKNAILSYAGCFLRTWKDKIIGHIRSQKFHYYGETRTHGRNN